MAERPKDSIRERQESDQVINVWDSAGNLIVEAGEPVEEEE